MNPTQEAQVERVDVPPTDPLDDLQQQIGSMDLNALLAFDGVLRALYRLTTAAIADEWRAQERERGES